jgi:hypothetical protein
MMKKSGRREFNFWVGSQGCSTITWEAACRQLLCGQLCGGFGNGRIEEIRSYRDVIIGL